MDEKIAKLAESLISAKEDTALLDSITDLDDDTLSRLLVAVRTEAARRYAIAMAGANRWII